MSDATQAPIMSREDWISLVEDLKYWRAEGPDEWIMDRFIRKAEALQSELTGAREEIAKLTRIKSEWEVILSPLLDFCRDNAEFLDMRVGDNVMEKALEFMQNEAQKWHNKRMGGN